MGDIVMKCSDSMITDVIITPGYTYLMHFSSYSFMKKYIAF